MSVRPIAFDPTGGMTVQHDELNHTGAVAFADVRFGRTLAATVDTDTIELTCPVCGGVSVHPVGGGADPSRIQLLFLRTVMRRAAVLGIPAGQRSFAAIKARIKARAEAQDGPGRFRLDALADEDGDPDA